MWNHSMLEQKCQYIFDNLGWDVIVPEDSVGLDYDFLISKNNEIYGMVEVANLSNLTAQTKRLKRLLENVTTNIKPKLFVLTNGFAFDVYYFGELYGCLTVPPTPEDVDLLLGGEDA